MLKAIGSLIILASAYGIGASFSTDFRKRLSELRLLKQLAYMLRGEIKYAKTPLPEAFSHMSARMAEPFASFLSKVAEEMGRSDGRTLCEMWSDTVTAGLKGSHLTRADREQLASLGDVLGYLDLDMQLGAIDLYLEKLETAIAEARDTLASRQKLCRSLGFAAGAFLVIMLL